ncbi:MAG: hypothetical protein VX405_06560 [Myxococcota bacterium]|jgi:hypothetical protein|nr:hypothetical protein [Myxococcota bacterium]|tara:strand:+ start:2241 stop:2480 length:240 start_codon:yes stop_codon:yes gene_type:complete
MKSFHRGIIALLCAFALLAVASPAMAKRLEIKEAFTIEGKIQKPTVSLFITRSDLDFKRLRLERTLIPRLLETIRKPPF